MFVFNIKATIKTSWNQLQKNEPKMKYNQQGMIQPGKQVWNIGIFVWIMYQKPYQIGVIIIFNKRAM